MSDYDNSVSHYAVKLGASERQVRRYCRGGLIPSAELTKGRTGRPKWRINDTSPRAIRDLREALTFQRFDPPSFCEPHIQPCKENPEGKIVWRRVYLPQIRDHVSLIVMRAHRAASLAHGMTESDITHGLAGKNAASDNKIRRFAHTEGLLVNGLFEPAESMQRRWAHSVFSEDLRQSDITQAAEWLATFHRTYGIEITHRSLARVLGMSKSALYRTFEGLVGQALKLAKRKAMFPTQKDTHRKQDEEDRQAASSPESHLEGGRVLSRKVPHDLAFEHLYNAVLTLHAAGKPIDGRNISAVLRKQGVLAEGEKLSDYFGPIDVANAVRAVTESQGSPAHQKAPPCPAT